MIHILSRFSDLPISVEVAHAFLRLSGEEDHLLLESLIQATAEEVETSTGLLLQKCKCQLVCDLPAKRPEGIIQTTGKEFVIRIPHSPFLKMLSVKAGERLISNYRLKISHQDVGVCHLDVARDKTLTFTYEAGYGEENPLPEALKLAILEIVAFRYEHRGEGRGATPGMAEYLRPYRVLHL